MSEAENLSEAEFDPAAVAVGLANEYAANIVEVLNEHTPQQAAAIVLHFPLDRSIEVLDQSGLECPTEIIDAMPRDIAVTMIAGMSADRVADIFRHSRGGQPRGSSEPARCRDAPPATKAACVSRR